MSKELRRFLDPINNPGSKEEWSDSPFFAHGIFVEPGRMLGYCPESSYLGAAFLPDHRRPFEILSSVEPFAGAEVHGSLYLTTRYCEFRLDSLELAVGYRKIIKEVVDTDTGIKVRAYLYQYIIPEGGDLHGYKNRGTIKRWWSTALPFNTGSKGKERSGPAADQER